MSKVRVSRLKMYRIAFFLVIVVCLENFAVQGAFRRPARCNQRAKATGRCMAYMRRFSYIPSQRKCEPFIFGGCGGTENRFMSRQECLNTCVDPCKQTHSDTGPCRAAFPRYSYNQGLRKCVKFIYGGCDGNSNNFETKAACERRCVGACEQQRAFVGPCRGYIRRYTFDQRIRRCVPFIYGGCQANANNFPSRLGCQRQCPRRS